MRVTQYISSLQFYDEVVDIRYNNWTTPPMQNDSAVLKFGQTRYDFRQRRQLKSPGKCNDTVSNCSSLQ